MMEAFNLSNDVAAALVKYPLLKVILTESGQISLSGEIELLQEGSGRLIDVFSVDITYPERFPNCFPIVFETGGKIERKLERHVNTKYGNLCLVVPPEERLLCKYGISTTWFIDNVLYPRLGEEFVVNNGGKYQREYSHGGANGNWEFYMKRFGTTDTTLVLAMIEQIVRNQLPVGHKPCICGSGMKFKKCHLKTAVEMSDLGRGYLLSELGFLKAHPYAGDKK